MTKGIQSSENPLVYTLITQIGAGSPQVVDLRSCLLNDYLFLDHPGNLWLLNSLINIYLVSYTTLLRVRMNEQVPVQPSALENPSVDKHSDDEVPRIEYQESFHLIEDKDDMRVGLSYSAELDETSMDIIKDEDDDASLFEDKNSIEPKLEMVNDFSRVKPEAPELS
jgi:hypothetical protein